MDGLREALQNAQQLPTLTLTTSLPAVLNGTASDLDVARSLLAICAVLLFLLAAAALLASARLLAGQREGESAMLTARGATRWQLLRLTAAEAIPLCLVSAAAGGALGVLLAGVLAGTGPSPWAGGAWPDTIAAAAGVAIGAIVIMLMPALTTVNPGTVRARRGRQAAISGVSRAGADLALILLAVLAGWQLRHYSAVSAGANGNFGVDPVVVIAPALALAGGTVLALRLLPACGKAGDRLAARGRRLTAAMASWQISRQPIRQGGAALLIVLSVATCTLALAQRQSWTHSDHDQASFGSGADVRVDTSQPLSAAQSAALAKLPGVRQAMPAAVFPQGITNTEVLAVNSRQAAEVTLLRPDQSALPETRLFGTIARTGPPPGVTLPGHAAELQLTARLGPASLGLAPVTVNVSVADADGDVYQLDAGTLPGRRPGPYADRQPGQPGRRRRRRRGVRCCWRFGCPFPAAADLAGPGLHAAGHPAARGGHPHPVRPVRRAGDDPAARYRAGQLARHRVLSGAGRRQAVRRHGRALGPARRHGQDRLGRRADGDAQPRLRDGTQRFRRDAQHPGQR